MNDNLEERIGRLLENKAGGVSGSQTLATSARRKVRRIVVQRALTASVAGVAALAVVVPIGLDTVRHENEPAPVKSGPPRLETDLVNPDNAPDQLDKGADPQLPYYHYNSGVIHDGENQIRVTKPDKRLEVADIEATAAGYLVTFDDTEPAGREPGKSGKAKPRSLLIDQQGDPILELPILDKRELDSEPVVSADGSTVAWTERPEGDGISTLTAADTTSGDQIEQDVRTEQEQVVGFVGERIVVVDQRTGATKLWASSGSHTTLRGVTDAVATDGNSLVVGKVAGAEGDRYGVYDIDTGEFRWKLPPTEVSPWVSDDGRTLTYFETAGAQDAKVYDVTTGNHVLTVETFTSDKTRQTVGLIGYESDGSLLFTLEHVNALGAVIRCPTSGPCERATGIEYGSARTRWVF